MEIKNKLLSLESLAKKGQKFLDESVLSCLPDNESQSISIPEIAKKIKINNLKSWRVQKKGSKKTYSEVTANNFILRGILDKLEKNKLIFRKKGRCKNKEIYFFYKLKNLKKYEINASSGIDFIIKAVLKLLTLKPDYSWSELSKTLKIYRKSFAYPTHDAIVWGLFVKSVGEKSAKKFLNKKEIQKLKSAKLFNEWKLLRSKKKKKLQVNSDKSVLGLQKVYEKQVNEVKKYWQNLPSKEDLEHKIEVYARKYQTHFRKELLKEFNKTCPISKINIPEVLIASHIVDYVHSNNEEKVDPNNGILLSPNADKLFDKKIITFNSEGQMLFAKKHEKLIKKMGLPTNFSLADNLGKSSYKAIMKNRKKYLKRRNKRYFSLEKLNC